MLRRTIRETSSVPVPDGHIATTITQRLNAMTVSDEAIAKRAYEKFEARGHLDGFDQEDWTAARLELLAEAVAPLGLGE